jgi:hypothetical protein
MWLMFILFSLTGSVQVESDLDQFDEMEEVDENFFDGDLQLSDDDEFHHSDVSNFSKDQPDKSGSGSDRLDKQGKYDRLGKVRLGQVRSG